MQRKISPESLKNGRWHAFSTPPSKPGARLSWVEVAVPLVVVILLIMFRAFLMAGIIGAVAVAVLLTRHFSPGGRKRLDKAFAWLAHWIGQIVSVLLLGPVFFIVMTGIRLWGKLTGADPLHLRHAERMSNWLPCDLESRRQRHVRSMFCTERVLHGRLALVPLVVLAIGAVLLVELGLQIYGFRDAVVYKQDLELGYYPKPNQKVRHPGRVISINNYGMRAADVASQKDRIRILMLGDSTLAGTKVSNNELYSALLEKKLNEAAGGEKFQVLNMGVNAWGPHHELAFVRKFGTFEADIAIICGPVGNCYRPLYGLERLPFFPDTRPPKFALEQVGYQLVWQFRERILGRPPWGIGERAVQQSLLGIGAYAELAKCMQQEEAEVFLEMLPPEGVTFGTEKSVEYEDIFAKLKDRMDGLGVEANCAGPIFEQWKASPRKIYHDGVHFSRLGHELYADYLFKRLTQHSRKLQQLLNPT
jgi:lysophospholipase L1-like esterase